MLAFTIDDFTTRQDLDRITAALTADITPTQETTPRDAELRAYRRAVRDLRSGDPDTVAAARDELDAIAQHCGNQALKARCTRALAAPTLKTEGGPRR